MGGSIPSCNNIWAQHHAYSPDSEKSDARVRSGGGYIMMLSDTKSDVMKATQGKQNPFVYLSKDADKMFSFVPFRRKQVRI